MVKSASRAPRPRCFGLVLFLLPLLFLLCFAPPIPAAQYYVNGPGDVAQNVPGTADSDTVRVSGFGQYDNVTGTWNGQAGYDFLLMDDGATINTTITNFEELVKVGSPDPPPGSPNNFWTRLSTTFTVSSYKNSSGFLSTVGGTFTATTAQVFDGSLWVFGANSFNCNTLEVTGGRVSVVGSGTSGVSTTINGGTMSVYDDGIYNGGPTTIEPNSTLYASSRGTYNFTTMTVKDRGTYFFSIRTKAYGTISGVNMTIENRGWVELTGEFGPSYLTCTGLLLIKSGGRIQLEGGKINFNALTIEFGGRIQLAESYYYLDGDNTAQTLTVAGTIAGGRGVRMGDGNDTVTLQTGASIAGVLQGDGGTDTLNLVGEGTLGNASGFEIFNKSGAGTWTLNQDLNLGAGGAASITGGTLEIGSTYTLTTNTFVMTGDTGLTINGTVNVGAGSGTITGDGSVQTVTISGTLTGNADLGGGNDTVNLQAGATINSTLSGGPGIDTLNLDDNGTLTATIQNFENLNKTGAGTWTLATNVDLTGLGGGATTISGGTLTVAATWTLTTNTLAMTGDTGLTIGGTVTAGTITGDGGAQTLTVSGTVNGNVDAGGGNDTLNLDGAGTLTATIQNFEILGKTGAGAWTLNTNVDLTGLGGGTVTISGGTLAVAATRTLTTNTLTMTGAVGLTINGTVTVGGGAGTITGDGGAQTLTIAGTLNGNADLGGGDDTVNLQTGATINSTLSGGAGTDTLTLNGDGTLTATIQNFETLNKAGAGYWTLATAVNLGGGGATTISGGTLRVWYTTLTTNTLSVVGNTILLIVGTVTVGGGAGTITGDGGVQIVTISGTLNGNANLAGGNDTVQLAFGPTINGTLDGGAGTDTLSLYEGITLTATVQNFETLSCDSSGFVTWTLDTDVNLGAGGTTTVRDGTLAVATGRTLITNTLNMIGATGLTINGAVTVGGGAGTITGDGAAQTVTIAGTLNGNADLGGGDDTVNLQAGATVNSTLSGGAGADVLNLDGAGTLTATILNFETLNKNGAGTWTVDTDINLGGGGTTTINVGTLIVAAGRTLTSPTVTVGATGTLGGSGQVTGAVNNAGTVAPGTSIGTLTVAGNYAQGGGGTLEVEINANGTNDQLHATGTANLAGTLEIVTQGTYTGSNQHIVLQADGGITGTFDTVTGLTSGNTLRHKFALTYTPTQVIVGVTVLTYQSLVAGRANNIVCVAVCLDTIANQATGDMAAIINQLDHLPDAASLAAAFQQLHCGHYNAFNTVNFNTQHLFIALGQARLYQLRTGVPVVGTAVGFHNPTHGPLLAYSGNLGKLGRLLSSDASPAALQGGAVFAGPPGDVLRTAYTGRRLGIWVRPFGIIEDQDSTNNLSGYNFTTTGFSAGFDYRFSAHFIAGISLGYATSRVKYDDVGGSSGDVQSYTAGVYGTWFGPRWFVEFSLAYGRNTFDMNRRVKFGGTDRTAASSYRGVAVTAQLGGGYDFPMGRGWTAGPVFSLEAVYQEQDGFTESGAGALNLTLGRQSATSVRSAMGVRVRRVFKGRGGRRVTLSLSALWVHEFANDAQGVSASLQGNPAAPFTVRTPEPERDAVRLGIGVTAKVSRQVSLFATYQPEFRKDNQSHYLSAGVRIEF